MKEAEGCGGLRAAREQLVLRLFPQGVPRLWCPTLTHFAARGQWDQSRIRCHLQFLAPQVKGILVPGSTGEGWEMSDADIRGLLEVVLDAAAAVGMRVLIGVLKTDLGSMVQCLDATVSFLRQRAGVADMDEVLRRSGVVGFTVCPPKGSELGQGTIREALMTVAERGLPLALYQLPQVTGNEMSPETVRSLAARYPNIYLFKDTSGRDVVAESGLDMDGLFLVRGAEGEYARWPRSGGGPYDGFLLSTANVFARELGWVLRWLEEGRRAEAEELAARVGRVVGACFELVGDISAGNAFTNANKLLDHFMAHGEDGMRRQPPLLYSGVRLPAILLERAAALLRANQLMPGAGYLG